MTDAGTAINLEEQYEVGRSSEFAEEKAKKNGWRVIYPEWNELFVDIDSESGKEWFYKNIHLVYSSVGVISHEMHVSISKEEGHYHAIVKLKKPVTNAERIALQCILGSDLKREAFSYTRYMLDDPHPTLFFEEGS